MAEIKAIDVKNLREKTGAGMMDCKNALTKANGDFAAAEKILKELGLAAVEKRSGRATNEGKVFGRVKGTKGVLVELACETDFVAKNADFIAAGEKILDEIFSKSYDSINPSLEAIVTDVATKIRENMSLKRIIILDSGANGLSSKYIHGDGKIGVLVALKSDKAEALSNEQLKTFAFDLTLHIAAFNPTYLDKSKVNADYLKEQEEIFLAQVSKDEKMKSKPQNILDGIVKGKLNKHLVEICLMEQGFVRDEKMSVTKVVEELSKTLGAKIEIIDYKYLKVGVN